jgi:hypothetical protein
MLRNGPGGLAHVVERSAPSPGVAKFLASVTIMVGDNGTESYLRGHSATMRYLLMPNTLTTSLEDSEDYAEASGGCS